MASPPDRLQDGNATRAILRRCWDRLNVKNEHWMHVIVGEEGTGKSLTSLKIGSMIDPDFSIENIYFHPADLLRDLRDENYQSGDVFVLDEAGVGLGNRTWHDSGQVKLNQALQLIRNHNIGLIFTLPRLGELDSQAKGRLQSYLELREKKPDEYVAGPWRNLDPDRVDMTGKIYRREPRVNGKKVAKVAFTPPDDDDLVEKYEEEKEKFQREFYDEAISALDGTNGDDADVDDPTDIAKQIQSNGGVEQYLTEINNGSQIVLDKDLIAVDHDVGNRTAKKVKKVLMSDIDRQDVI